MLGYTTLQRVERRSGKSLTGGLAAECVELIEAAERWIDERTGKTWIYGGGSVTEQHRPYGREIVLRKTPVVSITSITARSLSANYEPTPLDPEQYELIDPENGKIVLSAYADDWWWARELYGRRRLFTVVYVPQTQAEVDPRVSLLATDLVVFWLSPRLGGVPLAGGDIKSYSVGSDLSVTFRDGGKTLGIPEHLVAKLEGLRPKRLILG